MYYFSYLDNGLCPPKAKVREAYLLKEKFIAETTYSDANVRKSQKSPRNQLIGNNHTIIISSMLMIKSQR